MNQTVPGANLTIVHNPRTQGVRIPISLSQTGCPLNVLTVNICMAGLVGHRLELLKGEASESLTAPGILPETNKVAKQRRK